MTRLIRLLVAVAAAAFAPPHAAAPPAKSSARPPRMVEPRTPPDGTVFKSARDLHQKPKGLEPQLRHGSLASSADWPASFFATFDTPIGRGACTAALVGPRALLTAAHCVPKNGMIQFESDKSTYTTVCEKNSHYTARPSDLSADYALCKLDRDYEQPQQFRFEMIGMLSIGEMLGRSILLTGYGCTSDVVSEDEMDGHYRIGSNTIVETSITKKAKTYSSDLYAPKQVHNLFTDVQGANLCPGDSGGPAFIITDGLEVGGAYANRSLIGVNSRVFYLDETKKNYGASMISATGGTVFAPWAKDWAHRNGNMAICGVVGNIPGCRGAGR